MSNSNRPGSQADGLAGRVIVVTSASSGLGEQLARALAACGAVPVLAARRAGRCVAQIAGARRVSWVIGRRYGTRLSCARAS